MAITILIVLCGVAFAEQGLASYYGKGHHGRRTASGEVFDMNSKTCAHRNLPFGQAVTISYKGRQVTCRVNDRGPFIRGRIIDLSYAAAKEIGLLAAGVAKVVLSR